ncbi:MAG: 16S rRNA (cytosine(1402)-N(4))-methyltransferase [Candidatus Nealsonbacteria bacterium]|nr:MAG: 16S rRNA (cytosine(1402)-N(4))-methyltransferase [Candidatus Nealsonbacteria bacterium]
MHVPVLLKEVLECLDPQSNENFVDCTVGEAGHMAAVLEKTSPRGKGLGIEVDIELYQKLKSQTAEFSISKSQFSKRLVLINDNFANLKEIVERVKFGKVNMILFDLGMSSWHLEESGRGFSFKRKEPLDMRYNTSTQLTAEKILNFWSRHELERILREYGEEKFSRQIAENIVQARKSKPIKNTLQLAEIIKRSVRGRQKIHPATRTFQALRIAVNNELENLKQGLCQAVEILEKGGRTAVISFHSLEDRIVKNYFREKAGKASIKILTKKPITPSVQEIKNNPRARSAKLRAIIKD